MGLLIVDLVPEKSIKSFQKKSEIRSSQIRKLNRNKDYRVKSVI